MNDIRVEGTKIVAGAGALLSKVANEAAAAGLGGMEFAAGIPGSIGGAVTMNAGAYGGEMKDILESVKVIDPEGVKALASLPSKGSMIVGVLAAMLRSVLYVLDSIRKQKEGE